MKIMLTYVGGIAGQSVIKMIRRSKYNDIMININISNIIIWR